LRVAQADSSQPLSASATKLAAIALGSNLGDRAAHLDSAIAHLRSSHHIQVLRVSTFIETAPVGPVPQGPYLNAAALLHTSLAPDALLALLLDIEHAHGRERTVRWGPRTLDLDLLLLDDIVMRTPSLTLPHPRLHERRFVLEPLAQIAPDLIVPPGLDSVAALLARL
jgi:2-amino-4-hydroxy-6-hydroxymethyldihydropteridine diphosphokinase